MAKPKRYYAVGAIATDVEVEGRPGTALMLGTHTIPLKWTDGMIGAVPVFTNKRKAKRYADGAPIVVLVPEEVGDAKKP